MGNESSKPNVSKPTEDKNVPGILPIGELASITYDIENLVFASDGCLGFSYLGAVRVLEKLGILKGIKRFAGVGIGAILASLLAVDFDSNEIQNVLDQNIDDLIADKRAGFEHVFGNLSETFGWNSGINFREWLGNLLSLKSDETDLTFFHLYEKTGKELCVIATNIDKLTIEYFHPKTTPDMPIKQAVFMSIYIPVIFAPMKYGLGIENYHLIHGSLMSIYPIHCFDGWLLSMDSKEYILNQLDPMDYQLPSTVFNSRNQRTLGFYPIEQYREDNYTELRDRLTNATAGIRIPETTLGKKYKTVLQQRICLGEKFVLLRKASNNIMIMVESAEDEDQNISEDLLAAKIFTGDPLSKEDRTLSFPEFGQDAEICANFLKGLACKESKLTKNAFEKFVGRKILTALDEYCGFDRADIHNVQTYFGKLFKVKRHSAFGISKADFDRTVGILCGYLGSSNINFEDDDKTFLYIQGWNATVAFFHHINKKDTCDAKDEPLNQSSWLLDILKS